LSLLLVSKADQKEIQNKHETDLLVHHKTTDTRKQVEELHWSLSTAALSPAGTEWVVAPGMDHV